MVGSNNLSSITTTTTSSTPRLKREEFLHTKHDTAFSKWRVLIGPTDWEDYQAKKDGAERYRVANLPTVSGPGLYEIGVAVWVTHSGRNVAKLEPDKIVVVYLGQAESVRSRLQEYGRSGSHLVACVGLFKDVFSRGFPIVYRWAPMKSKSEAERTEAQLLTRFDYAWNKLGNGSRRPNDVLMKIDKISSKNRNIPKLFKMLQALYEPKVGIPINAEKLSLDKKPDNHHFDEHLNLFGRILKFSRSRPISVAADPETCIQDFNQTVICGVTYSDGTICKKPPVEGRKRCVEHKGRRITSVIKNGNDSSINGSQEKQSSYNVTDSIISDAVSPICGVIQHDGFPCEKSPLPGRKRCLEHKGMRVISHASPKALEPKSVIERSVSDLSLADHCGVKLGDGKCCLRQAVKGRKRCEEHKGMRVDRYVSKLSSKWCNTEPAYNFSCPLFDAISAQDSISSSTEGKDGRGADSTRV